MTIRVGDCVEGIPDDALEVFNIVGIGLRRKIENRFLEFMKIAELEFL